MMNEYEQKRLITELVTRAIESGKIKINPTETTPPAETTEGDFPLYEGGSITFFDGLTLIMFGLNLSGITDINWFIVFIPFLMPYVAFYGYIGLMFVYNKYFKKNQKKDGTSKVD